MPRTRFLNFPGCILALLILSWNNTASQYSTGLNGSYPGITGWADDTHYIIRKYEKNNLVTLSVDIITGKGSAVSLPVSPRDLLNESLPQGIIIGSQDVVSPDAGSVILIRENDLYFCKAGDKVLKRLTDDEAPEVNVRFSPDGLKIAYTKKKDLYVYDLSEYSETRLTYDASDRIYNGYSSWVYMEEILERSSRYAAFWWSPDSRKIAYLHTDETSVPLFTVTRLDKPDGVHGITEVTPYPKAGDPNPVVRMGIADIVTAKTTWVKTDPEKDQYIAWPFWTNDSRGLAIQLLNRDQDKMEFILADPASGDYSVIYRETSGTWIDFFEDIYVFRNGSGFIVRSSRNGWENLYYYGWDGRLKSQLTDFDWKVSEIERVDEEKGIIYFSGTGPVSTDKHFFRISISGKDFLQLTHGHGTHQVSISPNGSYYIDTWSSIFSPGSILALDRKANVIREIHKFNETATDPSASSKKELVRIRTSDGLFELPAIITYPVSFDRNKSYPVVFTIYGGPNSSHITDSWKGTDASWYSLNGIITIDADHRGSGHFGRRGMDYLYRSLGKWEIIDYSDVVKWLLDKPFVDRNRIGITGSSYGGYVTCLALTKGSGFWTHGFAVSPVTDFRLYDSIYTERYMDSPEDNPLGYTDGSASSFAERYTGKLFIVHGDIDNNVHLQNSVQFISKLQDAGKSFGFMLYPGCRHGWGGAKADHLRDEEYRFWLDNFFEKN
jgi:dipeptidyl-peptidase-4